VDEPLAILLLPARLDDFARAAYARDLLAIPRVLALEPSRISAPRFLRESLAVRQARRLRFPGNPRVLVLYAPRQYPLGRALLSRYEGAELWYVDPGPADEADPGGELAELDTLARARAAEIFVLGDGAPAQVNEPLRRAMVELQIISSRPYVPGARMSGR